MKDLDYYMSLPYTMAIQYVKDEEGDYFYGRILELPGANAMGSTRKEVCDNLWEVLELTLEVKLEFGDPIPMPINLQELQSISQ
ncbi:MAG: type II toxin-antitoxin system HicB family antitoxin [Defluviitaleaceae bacterium]|nr:type II toxin-antitoxin system HicB family antitoxin [Defluviitaleaceae bacterium]